MRKIIIVLVFCLLVGLVSSAAFSKTQHVPRGDLDTWDKMYSMDMSVYRTLDSPY